jgi:protein-disulfide isomerase
MRRAGRLPLLSLLGAVAAALAYACGGPDPEAPQNTFELPGINQSDFTTRERAELKDLLTSLYAPCPSVAVPVGQCVREKRDCRQCGLAARFLYDSVRHGEPKDEIATTYRERFDPATVREIPIDGSPVIGPDGARITLVEFADFECPACGRLEPILEHILEQHPQDVRLIYKFYPLTQLHHHAEDAARAGIAAMMQGRFWEMHHVMYRNQEELRHADLERYAHDLGIDVSRFKQDMTSQATSDRLLRDQTLETQLRLDHTPTLFMDGRPVDLGKVDIEELVDEQLKE